MTDQDILDRIVEGTLAVLVNEPRVFLFSRKEWIEPQVIERESNGSTYHFVTITRNGKKKKIARHRLVWMFHHRCLVPEDHDVDHIDGRSDAIGNLRLLQKADNRATTGSKEVPYEAHHDEDIPF